MSTLKELTAARATGPRRRAPWLCAISALALAPGLLAPAQALAQQNPYTIATERDTEIEEILHKDGEAMWRAAGLNPDTVKVLLMGDKDINAFTAGGQTIYINTGLIEAAKNPNQLIGVMAHETGHITGGHVARESMYKPALATYLLTMGLGILAAAAGAPDAGAGLLYSADYFATLTALSYSRVQEASADQAAATSLEKAHISAKGLVDFFDNYRYEEVFNNYRKYRFFLDHPLSSERIDALRVRVDKSPYYYEVDSPQALAEHAIMVAKIKAFMNPPQQTFIDYKETDTSFPARYARAIAYYRALDTDRAIRLCDGLIADYPKNPFLYELKGQILFEAGRPKEAETALIQAVDLKPGAPLLEILLGQSLLAEEDKSKLAAAIDHLQKAVKVESDNAMAWRLLAEAYDGKGQAGMARLAVAEQEFALGQMKDARIFAMRARENLNKDSREWRRATDILLASQPSKDELQSLAKQQGG
jgi:predicted Zn-dependent protease